MNTELYIETFRLDITEEISTLLTFGIDDIKDFSSRSTTWSKTVVLPGTSNNNKIFGHIFQVGRSNPFNQSNPNVGFNFNASKAANVVLFQDQFQTFRGVLRLIQINYLNGFNGRVEYEISLFGQISNLNSILSGRLLTDLDFSLYNHSYTVNNIVQSWDNPGGSGYYYPLIDYGTYSVLKNNWDVHTFRPSLYAKEYVDKIFSSAGYRYNSHLLDSQRFKKIIVPHTKKIMTTQETNLFNATDSSSYYGTVPVVDLFANPNEFGAPVRWLTTNGSGFTSQDPPNNTVFKYNGAVTTNVIITLDIKGHFDKFDPTGYGLGSLALYLWKNQPVVMGQAWGNSTYFTPFEFGLNQTITISVSPGDEIKFTIAQDAFNVISNVWIDSAVFNVKAASGSVAIPVLLGDTIKVNDQIPQNIRQIDFLVGIVKLFNLYVYEDKNDPYLIYITPFIDFYSKDFSNAIDWSNKLDRSKPIKAKPMSEINAKIYKFKFKQDGDYYNDLYRKRYNEGYGDRIYDSQFDFSQQSNEFDIAFSATPLIGYGGQEKVYSTIFKRTGSETSPVEENTDCNIRLLQTKKISNLTNFWQILYNGSPLITLTYYGYAGHLDDPISPSNDLNFGAPKELFFILNQGNLSNNQFNVYWSTYMAEITDKDSTLLSAYFKLTTLDIINLDFSKYIYIDGITFRINQIKDYNATRPGTCEVELFKVNSPSYTEQAPTTGIPDGCFLLWSEQQIMDASGTDSMLYKDCGTVTPPTGTYYLNWTISEAKIVGSVKIYINDILLVSVKSSIYNTTNQTGQLQLTAGDVVKVRCQGVVSKQKRIFVSNNVDGVINDTSGTANIFEYSFTADANKNYDALAVLSK